MTILFLPSVGRKCEMEASWQPFCAKHGGGSHTIVYNECTIQYFLQFFYFLAAPWCIVYSYTVCFHYNLLTMEVMT